MLVITSANPMSGTKENLVDTKNEDLALEPDVLELVESDSENT